MNTLQNYSPPYTQLYLRGEFFLPPANTNGLKVLRVIDFLQGVLSFCRTYGALKLKKN